MLVGYMRVSKADGSQTVELQRDALLAAGVDAAQLYQDRASGRRDDRPGLAACLKALRDGDTLVVWKLDRLGRNLHHLVTTVHELTARGVGLKVLTGQAPRSTPPPRPASSCSGSSPRWPNSNASSSPNAPSPG
jgi:DNA invertase Pin-like site-specific DNA recombinase